MKSTAALRAETLPPRDRRPPVRRTRYPEAIRAEEELASLLDQDEDDLAQHERGQRAFVAARQLAAARTRIDENRAREALVAIGSEGR